MSVDTTANPFQSGTDENERLALEECVKRQRYDRRVSVLILPAGHCELATEIAHLGAQVTAADTPAKRHDIEGRILAGGLRDNVSYAAGEITNLPDDLPGEPFDIVVLRRGLCSMPYEQARSVVRQLLLKLKIGGKLYISILGLHSELGDGYAGGEQLVEQRFTELSPSVAKKYGITHPVCLYSERNLFMLLLDAGASVLRTLTTTYGNVKGVAVRV
ncbi:hypothetical protein ACLIKD_18445 [Azonexus sp. IMCC34842]|uniref:hypothetical protein n=1 Tax=Azonexus sp. IMCC34842 TaxID=3420950 RepID=UPI003D13EA00